VNADGKLNLPANQVNAEYEGTIEEIETLLGGLWKFSLWILFSMLYDTAHDDQMFQITMLLRYVTTCLSTNGQGSVRA
jgi:hypothetical protein